MSEQSVIKSKVMIDISLPIFKFRKLHALIALNAENSVEQIIDVIFWLFESIFLIILKLFSGSSNFTEA